MTFNPVPPSPSAPMVAIDRAPLQFPGRDPRIRRVTWGGPVCALDVRMYLDRASIDLLMARAERSILHRVQLDGVRLRVELFRGFDGGWYEVWSLTVSGPPRPEPGPFSSEPEPEPWDAPADVLGRDLPLPTGCHRRTTWGDGTARMFLDLHILRLLGRRAADSLYGRVQLDSCGIVVDTYRPAPPLPAYEVWTLNVNGEPRPEPARLQERPAP